MKNVVLFLFLAATPALLNPATSEAAVFDGQADYQTDSHGYYYAITGGKFPTGGLPNGDNATGGTFRRIWDDPYWGGGIDTWTKDDWFPENAGLALTLESAGSSVYDNNGIEDGTHGGYYDGTGTTNSALVPGLYRGYNMSNNYDHIYATYFKLESETTFDTVIGYFDENSGFDRNDPAVGYRMNIWSSYQDDPNGNPNSYMPTYTGSFTGDVFSSDYVSGKFATSDTSVDRVFGDDNANATDDILRLTYTLDAPVTLDPGVYFFSHDATIVPEPSTLAMWAGLGVMGLVAARRRRRLAA